MYFPCKNIAPTMVVWFKGNCINLQSVQFLGNWRNALRLIYLYFTKFLLVLLWLIKNMHTQLPKVKTPQRNRKDWKQVLAYFVVVCTVMWYEYDYYYHYFPSSWAPSTLLELTPHPFFWFLFDFFPSCCRAQHQIYTSQVL